MTDDLSIQGALADTTVPDLLRSMIRSGESGTVSLESVGRHDNIYFTGGQIIFATSSDPDLGLAEVLLRLGDLDLQQYHRVAEEVYGSRGAGAVLCDLGLLTPDELPMALEKQVGTIVQRALGFRNGSYTVDFSEERPFEVIQLAINTDRTILDGMSRIEHWSLISRGIGRAGRMLRRTAASDAKLFHLELSEDENHIFGLLSEPSTAAVVCERSFLSNFVTCRTLWSLLTVNLLEDAEEDQVGQQRADTESEMELEWEVERYNDAFQQIFGLVFQRIGDHTYDFADRVATHLTPATLPYVTGISLLNEGRVDFDQLLNNLIAAAPGERQGVIVRLLTELREGWTAEVRKEFGPALESDLVPILSRLDAGRR